MARNDRSRQLGPCCVAKLALIGFALAGTPSTALGFDFHLALNDCRILVASTLDGAHPIQAVAGDAAIVSCTRRSDLVVCDWNFPGGGKPTLGVTQKYSVLLDTPPELWFASDTRADFFVVNPTMHAAVSITRLISERGAGSKVCSGVFMTDQELREGLEEKP